MSSARSGARADNLLAAIKRLPPDQLRRFLRQFQAWKGRQKANPQEAELFARVEEHSQLPAAKQARYEELRAQCESGRLTPSDLDEYQHLLKELEARNVERLEALTSLAKRRGITLSALMAELGPADGTDD